MAKKSHNYEFGGPVFVLLTIVLLPSTIYFLYLSCNRDFCVSYNNISELLPQIRLVLTQTDFFNWFDFGTVASWILFQALISIVLSGTIVKGTVLAKTKERLEYKVNGHLCFWVTIAVISVGTMRGTISLSYLYDQYLSLATSAILFSTTLSLVLFFASYRKKAILTEHAETPSWIYGFFMGRELNPRIHQLFDLKYFCELRPGLLGWVVLNLGMMMKQYETLGYVTTLMILINAFQGLYVWDALYNEKSILTTMDITKDGFGFMLAFGDLAWVPFVYTLQARYLVNNSPNLSSTALGLIVMLQLVGFAIFRLSNSEKDNFRSEVSTHGESKWRFINVKTKTGNSKLLISGWWGLARKINYTGDWLMGVAWCSLCGLSSPIPYFYSIYFTVLLVHRALRDDAMCQEKYGADWLKYKKTVPYLFIPYLI